jgi:hypothetical protein
LDPFLGGVPGFLCRFANAFFYWRKLRGDKARFMLTADYASRGGAHAALGAFCGKPEPGFFVPAFTPALYPGKNCGTKKGGVNGLGKLRGGAKRNGAILTLCGQITLKIAYRT